MLKSLLPQKIPIQWRFGITILMMIAYIIWFLANYEPTSSGRAISAGIIAPVICISWFFGWRGGIGGGIAGIALNILLFQTVGENGVQLTLIDSPTGSIVLFIIAAGFGGLSTLVGTTVQQSDQLQEANDRLKEYTLELEASNAELDAFAHTVAHDLKNPLSAIIGMTEMLQEESGEVETTELDYWLSRIHTNGQIMNNIIRELLLLASIRQQEHIPQHTVDMGEVIANVLLRYDYTIQESHAQIKQPVTWPLSIGYSPWIAEIWANYLSNAIKYGGEPPKIELGYTELGDGCVKFWIRDNGPGIDEEEQQRLFAQFARLQKIRAEGQGLGLSIVQRIAAKLDGRVGVDSTKGSGSTFYFVLPKAIQPQKIAQV